MEEKSKELAKCEVGWWRAHHEKDYEKVVELMTREYELMFGADKEKARKAVMLRVEAAKMHDKAESTEGEESEMYWKKAEELIFQHFKVILGD